MGIRKKLECAYAAYLIVVREMHAHHCHILQDGQDIWVFIKISTILFYYYYFIEFCGIFLPPSGRDPNKVSVVISSSRYPISILSLM